MNTLQPHEVTLKSRVDLQKYGANARLLFALETRFSIEDIVSTASTSLTDGWNDKKCDLVYVDRETGLAVIAQGYEATVSKPEAPANKASDLNTAIAWLFNGSLDSVPEALRIQAEELRSALREKALRRIEIWYVHNLPESTNVQRELERVAAGAKTAISAHYPDSEVEICAGVEVGKATLHEWYRALEVAILVSDSFTIEVPGHYQVKGDSWHALVTTVKASWLRTIFKQHESRLFSANVRDYLGSRRSALNVNHGIKKTAADEPRNFWAFNNGITAIVNSYEIAESKLTIVGISIVNGAQTTGALGSLQTIGDEAEVQARFVVCSDSATVASIIQFNNTQNAVEATDFRSNDPTQQRLRQEFNSIPDAVYRGGRRGGEKDQIKRPSNLLPSDTCGQALAAFHGEPAVAYNKKSEIWQSDNYYSSFFPSEVSAPHIVFTFSLLRAIEDKKHQLLTLASPRDMDKKMMTFLRMRGSTYLFMSAVSATLETIMNQSIPNPFKLSFGNVSPDTATKNWEPVIATLLPHSSLLSPALTAGMGKREATQLSIETFQSTIESLKHNLEPLFQPFRSHVHIST